MCHIKNIISIMSVPCPDPSLTFSISVNKIQTCYLIVSKASSKIVPFLAYYALAMLAFEKWVYSYFAPLLEPSFSTSFDFLTLQRDFI